LVRRTLLSHLIRIHQAGIEHLDVEPRNVVLSKSKGPVVVDVDGASLDHSCEGLSCGELREVARRLGINLGQFDSGS
jgi:tRNA A-37 threonylcarbamoyl transferase component Bud32